MGAELREFKPPQSEDVLRPEEINRLAREGIEIPLDQVNVLPDGTLAYKNQRVVLYIRDVKHFGISRRRMTVSQGITSQTAISSKKCGLTIDMNGTLFQPERQANFKSISCGMIAISKATSD